MRRPRHWLLSVLGAVVLLGGCKAPKKKVPPIKITSIEARAEVKDYRRRLKLSYRAVNIKNNCSGGLCLATLLTKISVYGPKGRIRLPKKDTRNRLDHKGQKEMTGGTFWFTVPLPGDAPAGTYTVRIEADDKLRGKWDVKKAKVEVGPEPIPTLRFEKVKTHLKQVGDFWMIAIKLHVADVYNRCREGVCKASYTARVKPLYPDGRESTIGKKYFSNQLDHSGADRSTGGSFSFGVPVTGKGAVGTWTLQLEIADLLTKKIVKKTVKIDVPKPPKVDPKKAFQK